MAGTYRRVCSVHTSPLCSFQLGISIFLKAQKHYASRDKPPFSLLTTPLFFISGSFNFIK